MNVMAPTIDHYVIEANILRFRRRCLTLNQDTMAFNKNSNGYTFLFAIVMVVLVGAILASLSLSLKPMQKAKVREKMMNILGAIGVPSERGQAGCEYVTERISIDSEGRQITRWAVSRSPMRRTPSTST